LLRYLLEAANRLSIFTPAKISNGFEAHELVDIFNEFARCLDLPTRAQLLSKTQRSMPNFSPLVVAKRVFEEGGLILTHTKDLDHWFLSYTYDFERKRYLVVASDAQNEHTEIDPKKVLDLGVVILPFESRLVLAG
jgi:hypothetical protein